jgi:7,8-dihydropterin-6-yl-methyl-4-(beta-D-ribofuranosyl)aminobenzene 5'-phosphate synthase
MINQIRGFLAMMKTTIKIIYDNCKENPELQEGWGFSALIETGQRKLLFDTGNDRNAFFSNTEKMGIDCNGISDVIFSHKHDDHIAGCEEILGKLRTNCRVYLPKGFPIDKVPRHLQIQTVKDLVEVDKDIYCMSLKGGVFLYEQSLILQTEKGLVIITGCAHPGIINIIEKAKEKLNKPIHLVLGGFHLFKKSGNFVEKIVNKAQSLQVENVAPCHCSGNQAIQAFQEAYKDHFYKIGTGSVISI